MRTFVSDRALQIPPSGIRKFFDLALTMNDVISLGVGEPDFRTPWNICESGIYSVEQGVTSYTSKPGAPDASRCAFGASRKPVPLPVFGR